MIHPRELDHVYRTFYEISPDLVCTLDEGGVILDANQRMLDHFGFSKEEVVGKNCLDFILKEYWQAALQGIEEMRQKGIGPTIDLGLIKKNGSTFFGVCKGARIGGYEKKTAGYLITIQDISPMREAFEKAKLAEEEGNRRYAELQKAHESLMMLEKKYRNLYENSPDLLRTIDLNGLIVDCNESYSRVLGYSKEEVIGRSIYDFTAAKSRDELRKGIEEWKSTGTISNKEVWLKSKDGMEFPTLLSGTSIFDENGRVIGRTVSLRNISDLYAARATVAEDEEKIKAQYEELKIANHMLEAAEKKFRSLYDTSPDLLRTIDTNGTIIDCNDAYARNLGYSKNEVIGSKIYDHTAEKSLDDIREVLDSWASGNVITNREVWMKRRDGTNFPALLSATTFYQGKSMRSNTVIKDITDLYEARRKIEENELRIREQYKELRNVEKSKEEFLAMITHELKTPLVPIQGYVDILLAEKFGTLTDDQKRRLEIIKSNVRYLMRLMTDLLDVQKIGLGQLHLNKTENDLGTMIGEVVENMRPDLEKNGIKAEMYVQQGVSCVCDRMRISQVISNLISNALDFCPKENGKIFIKLYAEDKSCRIIIKDNGIGIQKGKLDKIFVKFYQVDTSTTREHGGSGIGLAVCKGIVEAHGGKIWAESEGEGKGTEIHISIPCT
ncbi:MAG TPA: PAS domain-containing sensor histidine kinase [Candidatus Nitrosotalea sp.]|nr:PAS domain-containing sensor histidine kinase [Candidatus Nitrosotalea sp.]